MKILPWASGPNSTEPWCKLLAAAGVSYGQRGASEEDGRIALWLCQHRYLARRTKTTEYYRTASYHLSIEVGTRTLDLKLA